MVCPGNMCMATLHKGDNDIVIVIIIIIIIIIMSIQPLKPDIRVNCNIYKNPVSNSQRIEYACFRKTNLSTLFSGRVNNSRTIRNNLSVENKILMLEQVVHIHRVTTSIYTVKFVGKTEHSRL